MPDLTPAVPEEPTRITVDAYFGLVEAGLLEADDRVELLEGVIVDVTPMSPRHTAVVHRVADALRALLHERCCVRTQATLLVSPLSAPEPDVAVVPGSHEDHHPTSALLVVEVASSSLPGDRLSKARIYAHAGIPEYWVVNLRERVLEVSRDPDAPRAVYRDLRTFGPGDAIELAAFPYVRIDLAAILPARASDGPEVAGEV